MNESGTWKVTPLKSCILSILERRGGVIMESDLSMPLHELYGQFSEQELNKALLILENQGLIHITWSSKTKRKIQLMTNEMDFLAVGED